MGDKFKPVVEIESEPGNLYVTMLGKLTEKLGYAFKDTIKQSYGQFSEEKFLKYVQSISDLSWDEEDEFNRSIEALEEQLENRRIMQGQIKSLSNAITKLRYFRIVGKIPLVN
jgi:hypothetical protein